MKGRRFDSTKTWEDFTKHFDLKEDLSTALKPAAPWIRKGQLQHFTPYDLFTTNPVGMAALVKRTTNTKQPHEDLRKFFSPTAT